LRCLLGGVLRFAILVSPLVSEQPSCVQSDLLCTISPFPPSALIVSNQFPLSHPPPLPPLLCRNSSLVPNQLNSVRSTLLCSISSFPPPVLLVSNQPIPHPPPLLCPISPFVSNQPSCVQSAPPSAIVSPRTQQTKRILNDGDHQWHMYCKQQSFAHVQETTRIGTCTESKTKWYMYQNSAILVHVPKTNQNGTCTGNASCVTKPNVLKTRSWYMYLHRNLRQTKGGKTQQISTIRRWFDEMTNAKTTKRGLRVAVAK